MEAASSPCSDCELPAFLEDRLWNRPIEGLLITAGLTLVLANSLDLSSISTVGSAGFLIIFAAVNLANLRLRAETGGAWWISGPAIAGCLFALSALLWHTVTHAPAKLWVLGALIALSMSIEALYRFTRRRHINVA